MFYGTKDGKEYGSYTEISALISYVEIGDNEWMSIVNRANSENKIITPYKDGYPVLADPPEPTQEEQVVERIRQLENYLSSTDWYILRYQETGTPEPEEIKQKRAEARAEISQLRNV